MKLLINSAARLIQACQRAYVRKWSFLVLFVFIFIGSVFMLGRLDLLPSLAKVSADAKDQLAAASAGIPIPTVSELPMKITIPSINLSATIANPTSTDEKILDQNLLSGAVRYPTSAELGENGNVVIFGHSSYLPIVNNQAYKTFNGIQKLSVGDTVIMYSSDTAYTYQVKSVTKENTSDASIPLSVSGKILTLSTCDSFSAKTDRFVVVADFVESHAVPQ